MHTHLPRQDLLVSEGLAIALTAVLCASHIKWEVVRVP